LVPLVYVPLYRADFSDPVLLHVYAVQYQEIYKANLFASSISEMWNVPVKLNLETTVFCIGEKSLRPVEIK
jgi:hypothetical protein